MFNVIKSNISYSIKKCPQLGRFLNIKSVLVDFLVSAGIKPLSITSYNHLGIKKIL